MDNAFTDLDARQVKYDVPGYTGSSMYVHQGFYEVILLVQLESGDVSANSLLRSVIFSLSLQCLHQQKTDRMAVGLPHCAGSRHCSY